MLLLDEASRLTVAEIIRRATRASEYVYDECERVGFQRACIAIGMQAGIRTYLPVENKLLQEFERVDVRLVGQAGMLIVAVNKAWKDYLKEIQESSPISTEAVALKKKYNILERKCDEFSRLHPAEMLYAAAGLIPE